MVMPGHLTAKSASEMDRKSFASNDILIPWTVLALDEVNRYYRFNYLLRIGNPTGIPSLIRARLMARRVREKCRTQGFIFVHL